ncbi:hypothetical protein LVJ82_00480 [Vitreoscilla massiliensis]|uniref:Uncharacterized protein n=1 Tax=Vitreoscilla massiliensis TaxID=1689272 RepID=A0ABY4E168_9NEIS|nr:hypothetical protein [Vitreoscilla massiliensis]UOO89491.1 hypothetical protein LVJ82_00480 [Vitreoscilla massiliensis]
MAELTFKLWLDAEMTIPLPLENGKPVLRLEFNGAESKTGLLYFGSPNPSRQLSVQESSTDTKIKLSVAEANQAWVAGKAVTSGKIVQPENGYMYRASKGGTTGATAPTWPTVVDTGVDDGTTRWVNIGKAFDMSDIKLASSESGLASGNQVLDLAATLASGAPVPIWFKATNTDAYLRSDATDPIIRIQINKVTEKAV